VIFLRARARAARWREECTMVKDEMGNTIRYFHHKRSEWEQMAKEGQHRGHVCYAHRQADMWREFAEYATAAFGDDAI
jgi:hypothetical protein